MNQGRKGRIAIDAAAAVFLSAVLVFGLVASPLIVECIPRNGQPLIELLGHDPCRQDGGFPSAAPYDEFALSMTESEDPCLDLILDNLGLARSGLGPQSPLTCDDARGLFGSPVAGSDAHGMQRDIHFHKLAREPVISEPCMHSLALALRI